VQPAWRPSRQEHLLQVHTVRPVQNRGRQPPYHTRIDGVVAAFNCTAVFLPQRQFDFLHVLLQVDLHWIGLPRLYFQVRQPSPYSPDHPFELCCLSSPCQETLTSFVQSRKKTHIARSIQRVRNESESTHSGMQSGSMGRQGQGTGSKRLSKIQSAL
jgi:hypothetical protein